MKRSAALTPLSHDHQHGLAVALELTRATDARGANAAGAFTSFWNLEGKRHFREEEEVLLPALSRHVAADHAAIARVLTDHVEIRRRAADVESGTASIADLQELGKRLREHIRFEERVLFPLAEDELAPAELEQVAASLSHHP